MSSANEPLVNVIVPLSVPAPDVSVGASAQPVGEATGRHPRTNDHVPETSPPHAAPAVQVLAIRTVPGAPSSIATSVGLDTSLPASAAVDTSSPAASATAGGVDEELLQPRTRTIGRNLCIIGARYTRFRLALRAERAPAVVATARGEYVRADEMELASFRDLVGALLAALLTVLPPIPHPQRERIRDQGDAIISMAAASSARFHVPPSVLLVVAYMETHLGTDDGEGGGWGAPIDAEHPNHAGTSDHAARILARGRLVCGSWRGAMSWFRSGKCAPPPFAEKYVRNGVRLIERMHDVAGQPLPKHLYAPNGG